MAQCEKKLASGEQCSNQAIPGASYCQAHMRIVFRPATGKERADTAPVPEPEPAKKSQSQPASKTKQRHWQAIPSAAGQKPAFPGLLVDEERNILVAQQGIIWLQAESSVNQFHRLVQLLGLLSLAFSLSEQVKVLLQVEGANYNYILYLTPVQKQTAQLVDFYDKASAAARLANGRFYIGQDKAFVQYRDDGAPRGYDVADFAALSNSDELCLIAHWGSQMLLPSAFTDVSLYELCLHIAPVPDLDVAKEAADLIYALIPPPLYPLLAKYFHVHHLRYRLARLQAAAGSLVLFEIRPRPATSAKQVIPAFILDYLSRLPRVALLIQAYQAGDLSILLQWKYRYPLHLPHVARTFKPNEMLLLVADYYPNLFISPTPQLFDGDLLVDLYLHSTQVIHLEQLPTNTPATLKLEVLLRPDPGPTPPIAALILNPQEMTWLRQLLYLLDGEAFNDYMLYQAEELSVLIGNNRPIEGLPFGIPMRRPGNRILFMPLRSHFVPDVPWSLLQEALTLQEKTYTFLTAEYRLDLPETLFAPLSRILVAEPNRPRIEVHTITPSLLPTLVWTPPPELPTETAPDKAKKELSLGKRILSNLQASSSPSQESVVARPQNNKLEESVLWQEKARACEEANDFLAAAICYNFLNDMNNSARCYRLAATRLRTQKREGE